VFLQALGKYLHYKIELGELDQSYAYARASLLHYARWVAEHEYPYLHKPEILEYPTETWAAQDMRKYELLAAAAEYTDGEERRRFLDRAHFFFDYSVSALLASDTRGLARPVVLLLSNGFIGAAGRKPATRPAPPVVSTPFAPRPLFVPQKALAKRRLEMLTAAAAVLALLATIACFAAV
jgi:hypothetical protein